MMTMNPLKIHHLAIALGSMILLHTPALATESALKEETLVDPGSRPKLRIYAQDPTVKDAGVVEIVLPTRLGDGPSNDYMEVTQDPAIADERGDFLFDEGTAEFRATHTFSVVWMAMRMTRQDLEKLSQRYPQKQNLKDLIAYWDSVRYGKLAILPMSEVGEANAFYDRYVDDAGVLHRELKFGFFEGQDGKMVNTCESLDVATHEGGHSILDIIKPAYFDNTTTWTAAFHESWGDLTAIFTALSKTDLCNKLYVDTRGDLSQRSFLTDLAEQFGSGIGSTTGLRDLLSPVTLSSVDKEAHALSRVFTNAVYGIFKDAYRAAAIKIEHVEDGAMLIYNVAQHLRQMILMMAIETNTPEPTFSDFAFKLYEIAQNQPSSLDHLSCLPWAKFIRDNFTAKEVPLEANCAALSGLTGKTSPGAKLHICGTLHRKA